MVESTLTPSGGVDKREDRVRDGLLVTVAYSGQTNGNGFSR